MAIEGYNNSFILKAADKNQSVIPHPIVSKTVNVETRDK